MIAVARRQREPLAALGFPRERIEVIANGIAPLEPPPGAQRLAGEGEFGVLCVSRLEPEKRVDLFVRAVAAARRSEPRVRGFVAGDGRERARVEALAAADPGVELLGERATCPRCSPAPTRSRSPARPRRCR